MRHTPSSVLSDVDVVNRLVRENPRGTLIPGSAACLIASNYPVMLEETDDESISIVSHVGRPDERLHEIGAQGTVGIRLRITRCDARLKLSQDKAPEVVDRVIDELEHGEHYPNLTLAREMRRVRR